MFTKSLAIPMPAKIDHKSLIISGQFLTRCAIMHDPTDSPLQCAILAHEKFDN